MMGIARALKYTTQVAAFMLIMLMLGFSVLAYAEEGTPQALDAGTPQALEEGTPQALDAGTPQALDAETSGAVESTAAESATEEETAIAEEEPPLSAKVYEGGWSLVNLLVVLLTVVVGVALVIRSMLRPQDDTKEQGESQPSSSFGLSVLAMAAAIVSTILFTSTQDITAHMVAVDNFTFIHIAVLAIAVFCVVCSVRQDVKSKSSSFR
jgi:hypothetical protein